MHRGRTVREAGKRRPSGQNGNGKCVRQWCAVNMQAKKTGCNREGTAEWQQRGRAALALNRPITMPVFRRRKHTDGKYAEQVREPT